ncbi:MAG: hypothetical protein HYX52_05805 [Chloroflexi bacterium]|nr:hypothetical protein [Chloroflexota bacterium]
MSDLLTPLNLLTILATVLSLLSIILIGKRLALGLLIAALNQGVWIALDVLLGAYGLIPITLLYAALCAHSLYQWKDHHE